MSTKNRHSIARLCLSVTLLLISTSCLSAEPKDKVSLAAETITVEELKDHIFFLASDELGGRGIGSGGYDIAAGYAASQFEQAGCLPLTRGENGGPTFLQRFSIESGKLNIPYKLRAALSRTDGRFREEAQFRRIETANVVAIFEGSDPELKKEYVTVSAHLDHLGQAGDVIYNGADDNASGCAAVLELAEAVAAAAPRRSVVFALFGAEETGLHGSQYFVENCPIPLDAVIANVNLDMIGRFEHPAVRNGIIAVGATAICEDMKNIADEVNARTLGLGIDYTSGEEFFRDSDHFSFFQKGIPVIFFFDGLHEDFHKPSDDAEKIDYGKMKLVAQLACELIIELANRDTVPCASPTVN